MKHIAFLLTLLAVATGMRAQQGYNINITMKPFKNHYLYLGYHYGKLKALADSCLLDANGKAVLKGKSKLPGGIYFLVSPKKEMLFEFLLDKQQQFSIVADTIGLPASVVFTGSADNTLFQSYSGKVNTYGKQLAQAHQQLKQATTHADSLQLQTTIQQLNRELQAYREDVEKQHPTTILAALLRALKEPKIPEASKQPGGKYDSLYAYKYYKAHYWDGISFTDERLLRTPIFEPRLEKYYTELVSPEVDSIKKEVDKMLLQASPNKTMYQYLLTFFVQRYINPHYMGQDAVYVYLFEKYINNNPQVDWFTEKYRKYMNDRAYSLMANLIGQPAQDMEMVDTAGRPSPLFEVEAPYIVICFWDATCGHCKEVVPKLDSLFQHKWKQQGVKIYGVMTDGGKESWVKYIREHGLTDWIHVYQTEAQRDAIYAAGKPGYKQLYDVYQTPALYLLDKDKRIVAKKLTWEQIDDVLQLKINKK